MTKFLSDDWMIIHEFMKPNPIKEIEFKIKESDISGVTVTTKYGNDYFGEQVVDATPIIQNKDDKHDNVIMGIFSLEKFIEKATRIGLVDAASTPLKEFITKEYIMIKNIDSSLLRMLQCPVPVLIKRDDGKFVIIDKQKTISKIISTNK